MLNCQSKQCPWRRTVPPVKVRSINVVFGSDIAVRMGNLFSRGCTSKMECRGACELPGGFQNA